MSFEQPDLIRPALSRVWTGWPKDALRHALLLQDAGKPFWGIFLQNWPSSPSSIHLFLAGVGDRVWGQRIPSGLSLAFLSSVFWNSYKRWWLSKSLFHEVHEQNYLFKLNLFCMFKSCLWRPNPFYSGNNRKDYFHFLTFFFFLFSQLFFTYHFLLWRGGQRW